MTWLLNLFGEREWCLVLDRGIYFAVMLWSPKPGERLARANLTKAAAQHLARSLRHKAENAPRDVI